MFSFSLQLAGVVAVEVTGGPTVDFVPGRKVCILELKAEPVIGWVWHAKIFITSIQDSNACPKEGRLPDAKQGLKKVLSVVCVGFLLLRMHLE